MLLGDSCSVPLEPTLPGTGCIVTAVASETSQFKVIESPSLIVSGLALKALMTGSEELGGLVVAAL